MKALSLFLSLFLLSLLISKAEILDLSDYPEAKEISYGGVVTQVQPERYLRMKAPISGSLFLKIEDGTHEKGTIWAEFEPELIAMEREAMELTKSLYELKDKPAARLEISDSRTALENRRDELKRNLAMMDEILGEPDLAGLYLGQEEADVAKSRSTVEEMKSRLSSQISALEDALAFVGTPEQERVEFRLAQLQIDKKEAELERKERDSKLKLPFSGEFRYLAELPDDPAAPLVLQNGDEIAELGDYSSIECVMIVTRPALRQLPISSLLLEFTGSGSPLRADFKRKETKEIFGKQELIYIFGFAPELSTTARPLIGGRVSADLIVRLSAKATLVPKLDLVRAAPDIFREKGWNSGVETMFPGFRAISVGQSQIAISPSAPGDE